jgi:tetratricopeptide (TPR) repeat protein
LARLRAALTTLCSAASAKQHLVLCIDDAHWLDEPTAVAAFTLAEAAASHAWTIWATMRQDEIARDPAAMRLVRALQELPHAHRLELERLPPQDVASIVEQVRAGNQGAALDVEQLVRESAGNPFYLRELLHARRSPYSRATAADAALAHQAVLPQGILEAVLHRARHLPAAALHLLEAAAVLEQPVPFDVLGAVAKQERHVALEALHLLLTTGWLAEDRERGRYPFVHDKLREAIYASLTAALCRTLHGRAARALLDDAARRRADPEHAVVATHAERSGHDVLAAEHYALAGDSARRLFELRRAEALYTQALDLGGRAGTGASPAAQLQWLEKRGAVRSMLGRAAEAEGDLRRAIAMARAGSPGLAEDGDPAADPAAHLRLHIELGVMLQRHNRLEDAIGALRRALDLGIASGDDGAIAAARCWLGDVQWMREHNREARMHFESLRAADGHNNPAVVAWATKALFGLAQCAGMDARPALADALLDQALARAQAPAEQFFQCAWAVLKGWIRVGPHGMGEPAAALEYFERCLRQSAETQLFWYEVPCRIGIGVVHMMQRRHDTAIEHFDAVLSLPADMNNGRWQLAAAVWLTSCHLERGDAEAALATARRAERHLAEFGPFMFAAKLPALVTIALSRLGRANECEDPQHLVDHARREELGYVLAAALEARAEWLHARRDRPALLDCAEELRREGQARGLPQVRSLGAFWRAKAMPIATAQPLELESARPAAWPPPHPMRRAST